MALLPASLSARCLSSGGSGRGRKPYGAARVLGGSSHGSFHTWLSAAAALDHQGGSRLIFNQASPITRPPSKRLATVAEQSIYDFTVKDIDRRDVTLSKYKGKVLLIVNVASRCGLTTSNYTDLARLYKKLKGEDFEILAFPCNQFGGQEPGSNQQIKEFACSRFKAEYPIFDKIDVNGFNTAPVYKFLKSSKSSGLFGSSFGDNIKWNFAKFLVDKNGQVVQRFEPSVSPLSIEGPKMPRWLFRCQSSGHGVYTADHRRCKQLSWLSARMIPGLLQSWTVLNGMGSSRSFGVDSAEGGLFMSSFIGSYGMQLLLLN